MPLCPIITQAPADSPLTDSQEASETAMSYSDNKDAGAPFRPEVFKAQWQKSRIHTTAMGVSVINLVLLIMALVCVPACLLLSCCARSARMYVALVP